MRCISLFKNRVFAAAAAVVLIAFASVAPAQKLKADEIVARHLEAIGPADKRAVKNRVVIGTVDYRLEAQTGKISGQSVLAYEGEKSAFAMAFQNPRYPQDKMGFDGKKVAVGYILPGERSPLGRFIVSFDDAFSEGLFGSVLSTGWPLADLAARKAKVEADGTKKVDGRETFVLDYFPKGGSDVLIKMFIDKETFRHVRTEYIKVISAQQGRTVDSSARQREARYVLTEDYSDFKKEDGLDLPHAMKLTLLTDAMSGAETSIWNFAFSQYYINQKLEPETFSID